MSTTHGKGREDGEQPESLPNIYNNFLFVMNGVGESADTEKVAYFTGAYDLAQNSHVQDAFVIAVEAQARERLERLSALKRIKPVDMSKLSQQVRASRRVEGLGTPQWGGLSGADSRAHVEVQGRSVLNMKSRRHITVAPVKAQYQQANTPGHVDARGSAHKLAHFVCWQLNQQNPSSTEAELNGFIENSPIYVTSYPPTGGQQTTGSQGSLATRAAPSTPAKQQQQQQPQQQQQQQQLANGGPAAAQHHQQPATPPPPPAEEQEPELTLKQEIGQPPPPQQPQLPQPPPQPLPEERRRSSEAAGAAFTNGGTEVLLIGQHHPAKPASPSLLQDSLTPNHDYVTSFHLFKVVAYEDNRLCNSSGPSSSGDFDTLKNPFFKFLRRKWKPQQVKFVSIGFCYLIAVLGRCIVAYDEVTREVLLAEMPKNVRWQLHDKAVSSVDASVVIVDHNEDASGPFGRNANGPPSGAGDPLRLSTRDTAGAPPLDVVVARASQADGGQRAARWRALTSRDRPFSATSSHIGLTSASRIDSGVTLRECRQLYELPAVNEKGETTEEALLLHHAEGGDPFWVIAQRESEPESWEQDPQMLILTPQKPVEVVETDAMFCQLK
ncbi:hypothetical protein AAG570_009264 [Ranatra chinensis]|uniref:Uncharacterized protein n=1 Tax=Ranatra chinensis TaxID=642074 RepID=A0ABD0YT79_9HEMI